MQFYLELFKKVRNKI